MQDTSSKRATIQAERPVTSPAQTAGAGCATTAGSIGFAVSPFKFWTMSVFTCFLYPVYWGYQNFRHLNVAFNCRVWSAVFAAVLPLSFFAMLKGIESTAEENGAYGRLPAFKLAGMYLLLQAISMCMAQDDLRLVTMICQTISVYPLYLVQKKVNEINAEVRPEIKPQSSFSPLDIMAVVVMGGLMAWSVVQSMMPGQ